jgi:hypothetical protein
MLSTTGASRTGCNSSIADLAHEKMNAGANTTCSKNGGTFPTTTATEASSEYHSSSVDTSIINSEVKNDPKDTFSACLLVMDDNFRLREWIAYNYHTCYLCDT